MSQTIEVPVHCCCEPVKRLGWLTLPPELARRGHIYVARSECRQVQLMIEQLTITTPRSAMARASRETFLAVVSDDRPIEFWRTLPGFREDPA